MGNLAGMPQTSTADDQTSLAYPGWYFVQQIPDLMEELRWSVPAALQRRWFASSERAAARDGQGNAIIDFNWLPADQTTVSMEWILGLDVSNGRARRAFAKLKNPDYFWTRIGATGRSGRLEFESLVKREYRKRQRPKSFPFGNPSLRGAGLKDQFINRIAIPEKWNTNFGLDQIALDQLNAALGRFSLYIFPQGVATYDAKKRALKIQIVGIGIFAMDVFEFNDDRYPLGVWSENPAGVGYIPGLGEWVSNKSYNDYRRDTHMGGDFIIMTRPIMTKPTKGIPTFWVKL
jgi:hypothetical protein